MKDKKWPYKRDKDDKDAFDDVFDQWRKGWGFGFRDDMFGDFEEQFRKTQRWMNHIFRDAMSGKIPSPEEGGPYVYGWSLRVGPDGKPHFEEFGNVASVEGKPREALGIREPLVDVLEEDKIVSITAEIPGVSKEEIDLEMTEDMLIIRVDKEDRKYYKEVALPCEVDTGSAKAIYQNGVLDIELKKAEEKKKGKKIKIN
jgi:HSP20 family protein